MYYLHEIGHDVCTVCIIYSLYIECTVYTVCTILCAPYLLCKMYIVTVCTVYSV